VTASLNHEALIVARISMLSRLTVAAIWFYQGLVPKLLGPHLDEVAMSAAFGIPEYLQRTVSISAGVLEIVFAICVAAASRTVWPHALSSAASLVLLAFVAVFAPSFLGAAFNPVSLNTALFALSCITVLCITSQQEPLRQERQLQD
jgi:hypothetical protein